MSDISPPKKERRFFSIIALLFLIGTFVVYFNEFNGPAIRSDGLGYYAYLPAALVYHDPGMSKLIQAHCTHYNERPKREWYGCTKVAGGNHYLNKYPIGVAVMMTPFFLVAHGVALVAHYFKPTIIPDGFSSSIYHYTMAFASSLYLLLGLVLLKKILEKYFDQKTIYLTLIFLLFGTNLYHYGTYDSVYSHAYSFFLFAAFVLLTQNWYESPSAKKVFLLGVVSGLIVIVRPTNAVVFFTFILYGLDLNNLKSFLFGQLALFWKHKFSLGLIVCIAAVFLFPQLLYWKIITGKWLVYSYGNESFYFTNPQFLNVLFSVRKGLFFWSPILLLILPGFWLMKKSEALRKQIIPIVLCVGITMYLISCWWCWPYGGSFGHRGFIESFVLLAFPLATVYQFAIHTKFTYLKRLIFGFSGLCVILSMFTMYQYWSHRIPFDETTWGIYVDAFNFVD